MTPCPWVAPCLADGIRLASRLRKEGLEQSRAYADASGADEAQFIVFDRTPDKPWEEKIWHREERRRGRAIEVRGC